METQGYGETLGKIILTVAVPLWYKILNLADEETSPVNQTLFLLMLLNNKTVADAGFCN